MSGGDVRNELYQRQGRWVGDISANGSVEPIQRDHLRIENKSKGTPFNVLFEVEHEKDGTENEVLKSFYFETKIEELDGSVAVGIATFDEFKKGGWKGKGMFYNGNVTNGSAGLIIGFGDYPKQGDTIGVRFSHDGTGKEDETGGGVKVINYINGRCLGAAFHLSDTASIQSRFLPCLHVSGNVTLQYNAPEFLPVAKERENSKHADKYLGDWRLEKAFDGPELGEFAIPEDLDVILTFKEGKLKDAYDLKVKVGNTLNTSLTVLGQTKTFDKVEVSPNVTSTRMMPPPHIDKVERFVSRSLPTFHKMIVTPEDGGSLIMTAVAAEFICKRFIKRFPALSKYN